MYSVATVLTHILQIYSNIYNLFSKKSSLLLWVTETLSSKSKVFCLKQAVSFLFHTGKFTKLTEAGSCLSSIKVIFFSCGDSDVFCSIHFPDINGPDFHLGYKIAF